MMLGKTFALLVFAFISTQTLAGPCKCPTDYMKNGRRCGEVSAFCRPGGDEPMCGAKDEKEKRALFRKLCPKTAKKLKDIS